MIGSKAPDTLLYCNAVEWIPLVKLISPQRGKRLIKSQLTDIGRYAVYQNSMTPLGYYDEANAKAGSPFVIVAGAAGEIGYSDEEFWAADDVYVFPKSKRLNNKYLYYCLLTRQHQISSQVRRASIPRLSIAAIERLQIPVPCPEDGKKSLKIQLDIVNILDAMTGLIAKLNLELTARKKQSDYYRDKMLSFEGGNAEWRTLGELGEFVRGKRFTKADFVDDGIDAIHYGEIYTRYGVWAERVFSKVRRDMASSLRFAEPDNVIIAGVGETVDDVGKAVAWIGSQKVAIHDDSYAFVHSMNSKFISYSMQTASFISQKAKHVSRGKLKRLLIDGIEKVKILIPYPDNVKKSLREQDRIVAILDKFNKLNNSTDGLIREIELRQMQYEYYRNLLLSFTKSNGLVT